MCSLLPQDVRTQGSPGGELGVPFLCRDHAVVPIPVRTCLGTCCCLGTCSQFSRQHQVSGAFVAFASLGCPVGWCLFWSVAADCECQVHIWSKKLACRVCRGAWTQAPFPGGVILSASGLSPHHFFKVTWCVSVPVENFGNSLTVSQRQSHIIPSVSLSFSF